MNQNSMHTRSIATIAATLATLFFLLPSIAFAALSAEDHQAVVRAVARVFDVYSDTGVAGLTAEVEACPNAERRPRRATSPVYCLALDLGAMRLVEEIEEAHRWPSSSYFKLGKVMERAGVLLEETLPPTGAQQNALRPIMIAIWGAVNQETQQQFLVEMKKRADKR
jgi:hypothetical protein